MSDSMQGKVVLVAAASQGLGYAVAETLALQGASVVIGSRRLEEVWRAVDELSNASGRKVIGFPLDVTLAGSITGWVEETLSTHGRIDGLVVNAGGPPAGNFDSFNDSAWQEAFELTLLSAIRLIRAVLPGMKHQQSGSIVAITSTSAKEPIEGLVLSNVFRAGVSNLVKSLSRELGVYGVRINSLIPGRIETARVRLLDEINAEQYGRSISEQIASQQAQIPLGRYGTPQEFANAAVFLLSDAASYITGTSLVVDGGKLSST